MLHDLIHVKSKQLNSIKAESEQCLPGVMLVSQSPVRCQGLCVDNVEILGARFHGSFEK